MEYIQRQTRYSDISSNGICKQRLLISILQSGESRVTMIVSYHLPYMSSLSLHMAANGTSSAPYAGRVSFYNTEGFR
uniref:Uncharacterized protein n=1 Tax=Arundo donax TaxID=35708 RepID=A0A0A9DC35_ARUDO